MEQLIEYHAALESYKNEKFGLAGLVEEILLKNGESDNMQTEIPENLKRKMNSIEHNTEQMITEVQPINTARVEFAKMFASATSSDTHLVPNAVTRLISRQRNLINQVALSLKNAKSVTQKNSVSAWGKPLLQNCQIELSHAVKNYGSDIQIIGKGVQLPDDFHVLELEVETLIQQLASEKIENFEIPRESTFAQETRALYHSINQNPPVFLQI